MIFVDI